MRQHSSQHRQRRRRRHRHQSRRLRRQKRRAASRASYLRFTSAMVSCAPSPVAAATRRHRQWQRPRRRHSRRSPTCAPSSPRRTPLKRRTKSPFATNGARTRTTLPSRTRQPRRHRRQSTDSRHASSTSASSSRRQRTCAWAPLPPRRLSLHRLRLATRVACYCDGPSRCSAATCTTRASNGAWRLDCRTHVSSSSRLRVTSRRASASARLATWPRHSSFRRFGSMCASGARTAPARGRTLPR